MMKVLQIDFRLWTGCNFLYATHYYVNGKRIRANDIYKYTWNRRAISSKQWSDKNKHGVDRDYTETIYDAKTT